MIVVIVTLVSASVLGEMEAMGATFKEPVNGSSSISLRIIPLW